MAAPKAHADDALRERIVTLLSAYEGVNDPAIWRGLGPESETLAQLVALYNDGDQPGFVRLRAVGAAAHFPSPAARTFFRAVASQAGQGDLFVRQAVASMARAFGDAALEDVEPYLAHRETIVRETAAQALGAMRIARARTLLESRLRIERDQVVRTALSRALRR